MLTALVSSTLPRTGWSCQTPRWACYGRSYTQSPLYCVLATSHIDKLSPKLRVKFGHEPTDWDLSRGVQESL